MTEEKDRTPARLWESPPASWGRKLSKLNADQRRRVDDAASGTVERAAYLAAFLAWYELNRDHRRAVRHAQRTVIAVRRALRFSYPKNCTLAHFTIDEPNNA